MTAFLYDVPMLIHYWGFLVRGLWRVGRDRAEGQRPRRRGDVEVHPHAPEALSHRS